MVIRNVIADQVTQMSFIEGNYMVQKFSTAASDPALSNSILPRTLEACPFGFDATGYQQIRHILVELRISIQNRIAAGTRFRESFSQLLNYPRIGRMFRDIEMKDRNVSMKMRHLCFEFNVDSFSFARLT